jgi:hypothetical protein
MDQYQLTPAQVASLMGALGLEHERTERHRDEVGIPANYDLELWKKPLPDGGALSLIIRISHDMGPFRPVSFAYQGIPVRWHRHAAGDRTMDHSGDYGLHRNQQCPSLPVSLFARLPVHLVGFLACAPGGCCPQTMCRSAICGNDGASEHWPFFSVIRLTG